MAKILVTGGAGFIGTNLIEDLLKNHLVIVADNFTTGKRTNLMSGVELYEVDITTPDFTKIVAAVRPDYIVHLAAQVSVNLSVTDPLLDLKTNILGTLNVIEAARRFQVKKVIYPSSAAVYGNPLFLPITEKHPINPLSPYGISKHTPEHYFQAYFENYGLNYSILRLANVYGPRQDSQGEGGVVAVFIDRLLTRKQVQIFGDGEQTRDFIFVKDVARAITAALEKGDHQIFNIGSGQRTSVNRLFEQLKSVAKLEADPQYLPPRPGDIPHSVFDITSAVKDLSWEPRLSLASGLAETYQWYEKNRL